MSAQERPGAPNSAQERPRVPRSAQESSVGRRVGEASLRATWAAVAPFTWRGGGYVYGGGGALGNSWMHVGRWACEYKCLNLNQTTSA